MQTAGGHNQLHHAVPQLQKIDFSMTHRGAFILKTLGSLMTAILSPSPISI